jgi:Bacteriophage probable baseplate hub protein
MITQVRAAHPSITLGGKDYYSALAPYLVSLEYTDNCDGKKADDLSIELADRDGKFISEWMPKKGAFLDAGIIAERWFAPNSASLSLDCGRFWIDSIEFTLPERKVSVKGTSIPTGIRLKASKESRGWEDTTLQEIANQIAEENHMSVDWQAQVNPRYRRTEQHDESGLGFLKKRANKAKLAIKVHRNKIVIFDEQKLEEAAAQFTLLYGDSAAELGMSCYRMASGHFSTKVTDTTKKSKISHVDPETGEVRSGTHTAPSDEGDNGEDGSEDETDDKEADDPDTEDGPTGISVEPDPLPQARAIVREGEEGNDQWNANTADSGSSLAAKAHNREKNKEKDTAGVELSLGNPLIAAGMTFNLKGCGQFDGKWFIQSAHHSVGPDYKTALTIRKCLQGY